MSELFSKQERAAWGGFLSIHGKMNREIDEDLRKNHGITHVEFEVLLRLHCAAEHRMRIQDLSAQSLLSTSGTSRLVNRLEKSGWLTRVTAEEDRRGAYAVLTEEGCDRFKALIPAHIRFVKRRFLNAFSKEDLTEMARLWQCHNDYSE